MIFQQLLKDVVEIEQSKVVEIYKASKELLNEIKLNLNEN